MNKMLSHPKAPQLLRLLAGILVAVFVIVMAAKVTRAPVDDAIDLQTALQYSGGSNLPDFEAITNIDEKKAAFFNFLLAYVEAENNRIADKRLKVLELWDIVRRDLDLTNTEMDILNGLAQEYSLGESILPVYDLVQELVLRADMIPVSLVLAQAASESAWGTSRFAKEGNNIFGQWCFDEGCGLVPERRLSDAAHEVRSYLSIEGSVRSYFRNINTNAAYAGLRELRGDMRDQDRPLDALVLAHGLLQYSERGYVYISELHALIRQNDLQALDRS
jgi:Bax protein